MMLWLRSILEPEESERYVLGCLIGFSLCGSGCETFFR